MANQRIKGITIQIGGDTSDLSKSLDSVDKSLKNTQAQLKDVNKLLKLDPSNVELVAQKQRLLGDAIETTKKRLEVLKDAAADAEQALKDGAITQDQYDGLQREIIETETALKNLETQAGDTAEGVEKVGEAGDKLGELKDKAQEAGEALTENVTKPLVDLGKAALDAFNEVDSGLDMIAKKTGATGTELEGMEEVAKEIFGSMPVEMEDVGEAVGEINTRFGATGDELESLTRDFLKFSNVTGSDVGDSVASVSKLMKKFDVDSTQTKNVLGLFTRASQTSGISISELQSSLEKNGASLKELGFDMTSSVNLLAQMESNGVETTTAMRGFSKAVQEATKDGKDAETALREQIDAIKNASTETEALQLATELFGSKGAAEMAQAIRDGKVAIDDLSGALTDYGDVVDTTFDTTVDSTDDQKVAMNNLKLAGSELGEEIGKALTPVFNTLSDVLKSVTDWFKNLDPKVKTIITVVALLVAGLGPLLILVAKVITAVQVILGVLPALKGAILAVNGALAANPIAAVILAITALIAIFVTLWNNCEEFREFWETLWEGIQEAASMVITFLGDAFSAMGEGFATVGDGIMSLFSSIGDAFSTLGDTLGTIAGTITDAFQTMGDTVASIFETMWDVIKGVINTIIGGVNGMIAAIEAGLNAVIGALNTLYWEIPDWVPGLGGYGFGFDIPYANFGRIPELANGAVIQPNHPFLAMLGDQTNGTNIEAPLSTIKDALVEAMRENSGGGQVVIPVYIGQDRLDTVIAKANSNLNFISGGR